MTVKSLNVFDEYDNDFLYCEAIIKKHSKNFHTAFSQLPKDKARAVYAVYAFCRRADDAVDEKQDPLLIEAMKKRLEEMQKQVSDDAIDLPQAVKEEDPDEAIWRALTLSFQQFDLQFQPFFDLLVGQKQDLDFQQPTSEKELSDYSYYVAGSVGLMLLPILSQAAAAIQEPAIKLGEAMQRTNILRDIGEDLRMGRIYLPQTVLAQYNLSREALAAGNQNPQFIEMWEHEAQLADTLYQESFVMMPQIDEDCREALLAAALIYREILTVIRKNNYQVFAEKTAVPKQRKIQLLFTAKKMLRQERWEG